MTERIYGRIRLYDDSSSYLRKLLIAERDLLCLARKHRPEGEETYDYNKRIALIDKVLDELSRMRAEKGWSNDARPDQT